MKDKPEDAVPGADTIEAALLKFQRECPEIKKDAMVQEAKRNYRYASLGAICRTIKPVMDKCGLIWSWSSRKIEGDWVLTCSVIHVSSRGGIEATSPPFHIDTDGFIKNHAQATGAALTYYQRYTLAMALGLSPDDDTDGKAPGAVEKPAATAVQMKKMMDQAALGKLDISVAKKHFLISDTEEKVLIGILEQSKTKAPDATKA